MAAAGGVAATLPRETPHEEVATVTSANSVAASSTGALGTIKTSTEEMFVQRARAYAAAVQSWGDCVSKAARSHSGGAFDPEQLCDKMPAAADHGLGEGNAGDDPGNRNQAPGQNADREDPGKSNQAPGQVDDH